MFDWPFLLNFAGRCLLTSYFLKAGINNAYNWKKVLGLLRSKRIPLPIIVLLAVILTEILGSLAIIFNFYALIAATALIIFTVAVNFIICNYWTMEGLQKRNVSFVFYANIAVIGALIMITSMTPLGQIHGTP